MWSFLKEIVGAVTDYAGHRIVIEELIKLPDEQVVQALAAKLQDQRDEDYGQFMAVLANMITSEEQSIALLRGAASGQHLPSVTDPASGLEIKERRLVALQRLLAFTEELHQHTLASQPIGQAVSEPTIAQQPPGQDTTEPSVQPRPPQQSPPDLAGDPQVVPSAPQLAEALASAQQSALPPVTTSAASTDGAPTPNDNPVAPTISNRPEATRTASPSPVLHVSPPDHRSQSRIEETPVSQAHAMAAPAPVDSASPPAATPQPALAQPDGGQYTRREKGPCAGCNYFRPVRLLSELVAPIASNDAPQVLSEIGRQEMDQQKQEAELLVQRAQLNINHWGQLPQLSSYCGLREKEEVYLIAEIKNSQDHRGEYQCGDREVGPRLARRCSDCRHHVQATGDERDTNVLKGLLFQSISVSADGEGVKVGSTSFGGAANQYTERIKQKKEFEVGQAYRTHGMLGNQPEYLDYCRRFSSPGTFAVCIMHNRNERCWGWEPIGEAAVTIAQSMGIELPSLPPEPITLTCRVQGDDSARVEGGGFAFTISDAKLVVEVARAGGSIELDTYDLKQIEASRWYQLASTRVPMLPIRVYNDYGIIKLRVGLLPPEQLPILQGAYTPDDPWSFEYSASTGQTMFSHPTHPFQIQFLNTYGMDNQITIYLPLDGSLTIVRGDLLSRLHPGQWYALSDLNNQPLPLTVCRMKDRVKADFLSWRWRPIPSTPGQAPDEILPIVQPYYEEFVWSFEYPDPRSGTSFNQLHPEGRYEFFIDMNGSITIKDKKEGQGVGYNIHQLQRQLPPGQWTVFVDSHREQVPLKVCRGPDRLSFEWLPIEATTTPGPVKHS